jgi:hypothetical protein
MRDVLGSTVVLENTALTSIFCRSKQTDAARVYRCGTCELESRLIGDTLFRTTRNREINHGTHFR